MKTLYIKRIVFLIFLLEIIIAAVMLINISKSKYDIKNNTSGVGYILSGVPENVSNFINEKIIALTSTDDVQGRMTVISSICIIRSDKNLIILKVNTSEISEYIKNINGNEMIDAEITDRNSYELWFDFTDKTNGFPAYTLMSDEDEIYYWRYFK